MKTLCIAPILFVFAVSVFAGNPAFKAKEKNVVVSMENMSVLGEILDRKAERTNTGLNEAHRVIIIDREFNKIREESVEKAADINTDSTLIPIIYRSEFLVRIHNISYYMLQKN